MAVGQHLLPGLLDFVVDKKSSDFVLLILPYLFSLFGFAQISVFFYMTSEDCQNGLSDWHSLWSHSKYLWPQKNDVFGVSRGRVKSACTRHP